MNRLVIGLLLAASILTAQVNTASISGIVTDASGATVPDAQVKLTNEQTNVIAITHTTQIGTTLSSC